MMSVKYEIHDTFGAPQCGCEIYKFDNYNDMIDFLEENEEVLNRLEEGYAIIKEKYYYVSEK